MWFDCFNLVILVIIIMVGSVWEIVFDSRVVEMEIWKNFIGYNI